MSFIVDHALPRNSAEEAALWRMSTSMPTIATPESIQRVTPFTPEPIQPQKEATPKIRRSTSRLNDRAEKRRRSRVRSVREGSKEVSRSTSEPSQHQTTSTSKRRYNTSRMNDRTKRSREETNSRHTSTRPHSTPEVIDLMNDSETVMSRNANRLPPNHAIPIPNTENSRILRGMLSKPTLPLNVRMPSHHDLEEAHKTHFSQYLREMMSSFMVVNDDHYSMILAIISADIAQHRKFLQIFKNVSETFTRGLRDYDDLTNRVSENLNSLETLQTHIQQRIDNFASNNSTNGNVNRHH